MTTIYDLPNDVITTYFQLNQEDEICFSMTCKRFYKIFANSAKKVNSLKRLELILEFEECTEGNTTYSLDYSKFWLPGVNVRTKTQLVDIISVIRFYRITKTTSPKLNIYWELINKDFIILNYFSLTSFSNVGIMIPESLNKFIELIPKFKANKSREESEKIIEEIINLVIQTDDIEKLKLIIDLKDSIDLLQIALMKGCNNIANYILDVVMTKKIITPSRLTWSKIKKPTKDILFKLLFSRLKGELLFTHKRELTFGILAVANVEVLDYIISIDHCYVIGINGENQLKKAIELNQLELLQRLVKLFPNDIKYQQVMQATLSTESKEILHLVYGKVKISEMKTLETLKKLCKKDSLLMKEIEELISILNSRIELRKDKNKSNQKKQKL